MCGRYVQARKAIDYKLAIGYSVPIGESHRLPTIRQTEEGEFPTWNLCPTRDSWVFRQKEEILWLERIPWGLPGSQGLHINARAETAFEKETFQSSWNVGRCLVPCDGWYEWSTTGAKQPHYFSPVDGKPIYLAGLSAHDRFVLLTEGVGEDFRLVHHRRPVALDVHAALAWVLLRDDPWTPEEVHTLMLPESRFRHHPVSGAVNSTKNDGANLIDPVAPAPAQLGLL